MKTYVTSGISEKTIYHNVTKPSSYPICVNCGKKKLMSLIIRLRAFLVSTQVIGNLRAQKYLNRRGNDDSNDCHPSEACSETSQRSNIELQDGALTLNDQCPPHVETSQLI